MISDELMSTYMDMTLVLDQARLECKKKQSLILETFVLKTITGEKYDG